MSFRPAHHCAVCPQLIQGFFLMCIPHWRLVPHEQQQAVYRTWRDSQRVVGRSGYAAAVRAEYFAARDAAIDSAREALGMPAGRATVHPPKEQTRMNVTKPVRLELNNSGAWKVLGRFDAADDCQAEIIMNTSEQLIKTLHNSEEPKGCPTLRISTDDGLGTVLTRWAHDTGWVDAVTGLPL